MSNSSRSKSLALMFLLGAFLTGGAIGFAADRAMMAKKPYAQVLSPRDELARVLGLTSEQRDSLNAILDWRNAEDRELTRPLRPMFDANRDSARVLIMNQLSEEQKQSFRDFLERQEAEREKRNAKRNQKEGNQ